MDPLRLVADERCAICAARGAVLCPPCRRALPWLAGPLCARCGEPDPHGRVACPVCARLGPHVASARSALLHADGGAALVRAWKDGARRHLGSLAAACIAGAIPRPAVDAVVPVPAARGRAAWRGVDGPCDLAHGLAALWGLPLAADALVRVHDRPQRGLGAAERRANAARAFAPGQVPRGRVLLVDDVLTTGATVRAAAAALHRGGAGRVDAVTLARVATIV